MEYTGERYLPWEPNVQASYEHYHRYALALSFARGKRILDLASGEGYGAALLAGVATKVVGVDINAQAVAHADTQYGGGNLKFIHGAIQNIPIQDGTFDLITCFEAIEHVKDQEHVLEESLRLLTEDGLLLISTPNRLLFTNEGDQPWPWHVKEFDDSEFQSFLHSKFKDVIFLGQKVLTGSAIWPLERGTNANGLIDDVFIKRSDGKTGFVGIGLQKPMFFLAIAAKRDLSELRRTIKSNYLVDVSLSLLNEKNELIKKLQGDVAILDEMVRNKDQYLVSLIDFIDSEKKQLAIIQSQSQQKEQELRAANAIIGTLSQNARYMPLQSKRWLETKPILNEVITKPQNNMQDQLRNGMAVCTIASKNYLSLVRVFAKSMADSNPDISIYVLLVDRIDGEFNPQQEPYHVVTLEELDNIPNPEHLFFKYTPIELNTAVKPYFLEYLMRKFQIKKICYFDPDIYVFSKLDAIWDLLELSSMVLTPHITAPYSDDLHPTEMEINLAGVFNLGFIGISNTPTTAHFLAWWQDRLYDHCYMKPSQGMHVDQNWVNFAPGMYDGIFILRDVAYNIAYWNLHERGDRLSFENGNLYIDHRMAVFFHFSGFNPKMLDIVSIHQNRFSLNDFPNVRPLYEFYRDAIQNAEYANIKHWPYAFGKFENGVDIPQLARTLYGQLDSQQILKFGNPFSVDGEQSFFSWINEPIDGLVANDRPTLTRLHMEIYAVRSDLQAAFIDPLGVNREQFINWLNENASKDFDLDEVFLPRTTSVKRGTTGARLSSLQFVTQWLTRILHRSLKRYAKRVLSSDGYLFQKLRILNKKYFEKRGEIFHTSTSPIGHFQSALPFGVNVAGYIQGEFGVAEVARASLKSLSLSDVPHVLNNVKAHAYREEDPTFAEFSTNNPYRINLVHVNADQAPIFAQEKGNSYFQGRYNIGCWFWELASFPDQWRSSFDYYQEIWVASGFCQESIASKSPIPVVKMTFPILIDDRHAVSDRKRFGLPEDKFLYGFVFDYMSLAERKNPYGLLKAFEAAFEKNDDVMLVIKTINAEYAPEKAQRLQEAAKACHANIRFIDGYIPRKDAICLVASCDGYVSLHRSEGLGIGMAQAMYLKKPVIATGYSGNMDFMDQNNSFLVRHQLTELQENHGPYEKGSVWAEPDLEHAAELMKLVFDNQTLSQKIGKRAGLDIKTKMNPEVTGREMKSRLLLVA